MNYSLQAWPGKVDTGYSKLTRDESQKVSVWMEKITEMRNYI